MIGMMARACWCPCGSGLTPASLGGSAAEGFGRRGGSACGGPARPRDGPASGGSVVGGSVLGGSVLGGSVGGGLVGGGLVGGWGGVWLLGIRWWFGPWLPMLWSAPAVSLIRWWAAIERPEPRLLDRATK